MSFLSHKLIAIPQSSDIRQKNWWCLTAGGPDVVKATASHRRYKLPQVRKVFDGCCAPIWVWSGKSAKTLVDLNLGTTLLFTGLDISQLLQKRAHSLRVVLAAH